MKNESPKKQALSMCVSVPDAHRFGFVDVVLPPDQEYSIIIDYPLRKPATFKVKTGKRGMGTSALIRKVGQLYNKVYANEAKHGVWGHEMQDLILSGIVVDHVRKLIQLSVDS